MRRWKRSLGALLRHSVLTRCTLRARSSEDAKKPNPPPHGFNTNSGKCRILQRTEVLGLLPGEWAWGKRETAEIDLCSQKKIYNFNSLMWARFYWMPFFFFKIESWHTTKNKESTQWSSSNSFSVLTHARWQRKVIQPSRENHKS